MNSPSLYASVNRDWVSYLINSRELFTNITGMKHQIHELCHSEIKSQHSCTDASLFTVKGEPSPVDVDVVKLRSGLFDKIEIGNEEVPLETIKQLKIRNQNHETVTNLKYSSTKWILPHGPNTDLTPGEHLVVNVRVYHPFKHSVGQRNARAIRCSQEFNVLGHQTLDVIKDAIFCTSDLSVAGNFASDPDRNRGPSAKQLHKSGFLFIENTFYNDFRDPYNNDDSQVVLAWATQKGILGIESKSLTEVHIQDLHFRFGYPYVYQHQGNCEHLIIISDMRFLHKGDVLSSGQYPVMISVFTMKPRYCAICKTHVATWLTYSNERVPRDPCFFCETCFKSYNYINNKPIGDFTAHPYFDRANII